MHNIAIDLLSHLQATGPTPLEDRLVGTADLTIQHTDELAADPDDLIPQERKRPVASPVSSIKLITKRASTTMQVLHEIHLQRYEAHSHWGINE